MIRCKLNEVKRQNYSTIIFSQVNEGDCEELGIKLEDDNEYEDESPFARTSTSPTLRITTTEDNLEDENNRPIIISFQEKTST